MPPELPEPPKLPHDIANPEDFLHPPWWHSALIATAAALVLGILIYFIIKRLKRPAASALVTESPFETAKKHLTALRDQAETNPVGDIATQCSLAVRECLGKALREPVLFETDEEIKLRPDSLAKAPESLRPDLINLLENLGETKYAPSQVNESQSLSWIDQSETALNQLRMRSGTEPG